MTIQRRSDEAPTRSEDGSMPAGGLILALLSLGTILALHAARKPRTAPHPTAIAPAKASPVPRDPLIEGAEDLNHRLAIIRGHCELAKMKGENGEALDRRMNAAIETVNETAALVQQLLASKRRRGSGGL